MTTGVASLKRGRYLVRRTPAYLYLRGLDALMSLVPRRRRVSRGCDRLLIGIGGHIGDAIIASSILPTIRQHFPNVAIGLVLSSSGAEVLRGHSDVRWIHEFDHWRTDRSRHRRSAKFIRWVSRLIRLRRELLAIDYDVAIDLYPFHPNMAIPFWAAGIPVRIGYESGGAGALYTRALPWSFSGEHTARQHQVLLEALVGTTTTVAPAYDLPEISATDEASARALLASREVSTDYVVLNVGTGDARKSWPTEHWIEIARQLRSEGRSIVVTGFGERDSGQARSIGTAVPEVVDLVGSTTIGAFRSVLRGASLVISGDSAGAHLAAAARVPLVTIMAAMSDPRHWYPLSDVATLCTHPMPCAPCLRSVGCAGMHCVRGVTPSDVMAASREIVTRASLNRRVGFSGASSP